ncbi:MAG: Gfo/Idh/MocA family oxidoreductase [Burkholderiales bacterium]|nr:Gfo/Idh/MocA family oxidoreductase [Burkholderiales bacterium]
MTRIRTAVIGAGHIGRFHADKFAASPAAELTAIADTDVDRAAQAAAALGCAHAADYRTLLDGIDAACVAVPTDKHHDVVRDCLTAGVHVLVEKPVARTLEETDTMLALARSRGLVLQVGHLQRFNPAFRALAGAGGRPLFIDIERLAPFRARGTDVDVVLDLMIHDLDLVLALAASPVEQLSACGFRVLTDAIDIANARIEFADGCVANVSASRVSQAAVRKLRVFRADGYASADLQEQRLREARRGPAGIEEAERAFDRVDELGAQAEDFLRAVRAGAAPLVGGEQGRAALALALSIAARIEGRRAR